MNPYDLPKSVWINGREYEIRSDYRAILDILIALRDPDMDDETKAAVMLMIFYPNWKELRKEDIAEAQQKAVEFIDCGYKDDGKPHPQLVDWEQDASLIIPAVNKAAHMEVRSVQYMHWWTFFSFYMEIGESLFSNVINIRSKKAKHKKLEKYEREFYNENRAIIDIKKKDSAEVREEKDAILKWLDRQGVSE